MITVYNHEGEFSYERDGDLFIFRGAEIFVNATASVVYGRTAEGLEWEIDSVRLVYATDVDGEDLVLSADEEKELETLIAFELSRNDRIEEQVYEAHEEITYWENRR